MAIPFERVVTGRNRQRGVRGEQPRPLLSLQEGAVHAAPRDRRVTRVRGGRVRRQRGRRGGLPPGHRWPRTKWRSWLRSSKRGSANKSVRDLARALDLPIWDKPSSPCLASRIPYYEPVTREKLASDRKGGTRAQVSRLSDLPRAAPRRYGFDRGPARRPSSHHERRRVAGARRRDKGRRRFSVP